MAEDEIDSIEIWNISSERNTPRHSRYSLPHKIVERTWLWPVSQGQNLGPELPLHYSAFRLIDLGTCYHPFCDDFGPMNLAAVYRFCCTLEEKYGKNCADVVVISANDKKDITNAAFLLGAHLQVRQSIIGNNEN